MVHILSKSPVGRMKPKAHLIASASADETIKLWRTDGTLFRTLNGHKNQVVNVAFSPNSKKLASASYDGTVGLWWNLDTNKSTPEKKFLKGHSAEIWHITFSPDGQLIASASADNTIKIWKADGTLLTTLIGHKEDVNYVNFGSDSQSLVSASSDKTVKLWHWNNNPKDWAMKTIAVDRYKVLSAKFFPGTNKRFVYTSSEGEITIISINVQGITLSKIQGHKTSISEFTFSSDGKSIITASRDKTVRIWTVNTKEQN